jgi:hypothetical protein
MRPIGNHLEAAGCSSLNRSLAAPGLPSILSHRCDQRKTFLAAGWLANGLQLTIGHQAMLNTIRLLVSELVSELVR